MYCQRGRKVSKYGGGGSKPLQSKRGRAKLPHSKTWGGGRGANSPTLAPDTTAGNMLLAL